MSIRTRIALIVSVVALGSTAAGFAIQRTVLFERFLDLERQSATDDLGRCVDTVRREIHHVTVRCGSWATSDGVRRFVTGRDDSFVAANLSDAAMANVRFSACWFVAADGRVVHSRGYDFESCRNVAFPELPSDRFPADHPLLPRKSETHAVSGILRTANGPLLVASRPIVVPGREGPPAGWFIAGRLLSNETVELLQRQTRVRFHAWDAGDPAIDADTQRIVDAGAARVEPVVREHSGDTLHVVGTMDDIYGRPTVVIRADVPRSISQQGAQSMQVATASMIVAGGGTVAVLLVLLGATVVSPLARLTDHATRIGKSGDLGARSGISRADEIGTLADAFDGMVGKLAESRGQIADVARRAGMADVARGVLHNVGNVLTSVNVSAGTIASTLAQSRADGLLRGVAMIEEHRADLAQFLERDERGRMLPEYLVRAAAVLREEQTELAAEVERMQQAVGHAAEIVSHQHELAAGPTLVEPVSLAAAVDGAVALVAPSLARHRVAVERGAGGDATIVVDRTKLTEILVNLLTNAKEAVLLRGTDGRRIVVRSGTAGGRARIVVEDNGCGIAPEAAARIFESGFSTKRNGRGFGLHFCAVAARELGGSLRVESDGPGHGAVFTLEFPAAARDAAATESQTPSLAGSPS